MDFEQFQLRLRDMLDAAITFGFSDSQAEDLQDALMEDFEEDPKEAYQNLNFWENEFDVLLDEEMEVAA